MVSFYLLVISYIVEIFKRLANKRIMVDLAKKLIHYFISSWNILDICPAQTSEVNLHVLVGVWLEACCAPVVPWVPKKTRSFVLFSLLSGVFQQTSKRLHQEDEESDQTGQKHQLQTAVTAPPGGRQVTRHAETCKEISAHFLTLLTLPGCEITVITPVHHRPATTTILWSSSHYYTYI